MKIRLTTVIKQAAAAFVVHHHQTRRPEPLLGMERVLFRLEEKLAPEFKGGSADLDVHDLDAMLKDALLDSTLFPEVEQWNGRGSYHGIPCAGGGIDTEQLIDKLVIAIGDYELYSENRLRSTEFFDPLDSNDNDPIDVEDFGDLIIGERAEIEEGNDE